MKFSTLVSCEDLDSTLITLTGLTNATYSAQMCGAPKWAQTMYFEDHVNSSPQWQQWFAAGLAMTATSTCAVNACSLTKAQKKTVLKACGTNHAIAVGLMAKQMADGDFKKPIGFATVGLLGVQAVACFARAFHKDADEA